MTMDSDSELSLSYYTFGCIVESSISPFPTLALAAQAMAAGNANDKSEHRCGAFEGDATVSAAGVAVVDPEGGCVVRCR